MEWAAASIEDAERVRIEAAKASDDFLPPKERRSRVESIRVASLASVADKVSDKLDAPTRGEDAAPEPVKSGAVVYYLGDYEVRVVGLGRGGGNIAVAFVDEHGLNYTEIASADCSAERSVTRE